MISFEVRWNPESDRWQFRGKGSEGAVWSEPLRLANLITAMRREVTPPEELKDWGKPIAHSVKRRSSMDSDVQRYEIRGGKVERIPATRTEKQNMELAELMSLIGDEDDE